MRSRTRSLVAVLAAAVALVVAACADGGGDGASGSGGGDGTTVAAGDRPDVSGLRLTDVATGEGVDLADALDAPPSTPVLAFFWAPF